MSCIGCAAIQSFSRCEFCGHSPWCPVHDRCASTARKLLPGEVELWRDGAANLSVWPSKSSAHGVVLRGEPDEKTEAQYLWVSREAMPALAAHLAKIIGAKLVPMLPADEDTDRIVDKLMAKRADQRKKL